MNVNSQPYQYLNKDLTEAEKWKYLALHHELTNLPNRRMLNMSLDRLIKEAVPGRRQLAVVVLDIDQFKSINDHWGHLVGDLFLKEIADRLFLFSSLHRFQVFHISGDEFVIVINIKPGENPAEKVDSILTVFDQPFVVNQRKFTVTCSMGMSLYPAQSTSIQELIHYADQAMYEAKRSCTPYKIYKRN